MVLISCDQEDVRISLDGMYVNIDLPQRNESVGGRVEFLGLLHADTLKDITQLRGRWISDKDGILFEHPMEKNGRSNFTTDKLSRNIHEITFEVSNGHGISVQETITIQNVIHLTANGTGYSNRLEWTVPGGNIKNLKLYRSTHSLQLKQDLPILRSADLSQLSFMDSTALLNDTRYYQLEAEFDGHVINSNIASARAGIGLGMDYPLMKLVFDEKRNYAYGIVSPGSGNENQTGYGLVFINTTNPKVEKRILENIRFNDLDIDPQGDRLYVSQRNRKIYIIDLDTKEVAGTIDLQNYIRKLEVGSNNRLYFHVELAANNNYEFRIVDLVTKTELPFKYSGNAGGSFHRGDMDLDNSTNTIYFSGPAKITTSFDIFSDMVGDDCCEAGESVVFRNGKVFVKHQLFNKDLVFLGNFIGKNGHEEHIYDCNADGTLAVGWYDLFNVSDRSIRKSIPAHYDQALFLNNNRLMLVDNSNPEYQRYRSIVYIYPFDKQ
jgi:hypothetical protein